MTPSSPSRVVLSVVAAAAVVAPLAASAVVAPLAASATSSSTPLAPLALAQRTAERLGTTLAAADTPLSSDNVSLVTTVPGTYVGMRIVGKRAFATGWDGLTAFDISDPAKPVPTGVLPLAHFENEDVDSDGKIALISSDRAKESKGAVLFVVDVSGPVPELVTVVNLSDLGSDQRGPGHIASCVGPRGCKWAWITGGRKIWVVDLRDPSAPKLVRGFETPASNGSMDFGGRGKKHGGATHDVERDEQGRLWVNGSGGMAVYAAKHPAQPRLLASTGRAGINPRNNQFILHNTIHPDARAYRPRSAGDRGGEVRRGEVLLMTEENYTDTNTEDSEPVPGGCREQGRMETWDVRDYSDGRTPKVLDRWTTEVGAAPYLSGNHAPVTVFCSSHWFNERKGIVANGWYEQGTRLLDVRDPENIRQIGYWIPPNAVTWAAYWVTDEIVYTADVGRGLDVLRVTRGAGGSAPTVTAPIRSSWLGAAANLTSNLMRESKRWSYFCAEPARPVHHRVG